MSSTSWYKETDEKINYTKLCRLLVGGGTQALCSVFDGKYSPSSLRDFLNGNKETLQKLKKPKGKVLNDEQWDKLYPKNGSDGPQSKDFDITLLFVLLRNICGLKPPASGWDVLPLATDNSLEANLARIKYYRSNAIAHKSNTEINYADFKQHWQDISSALLSLGLSQDDIDYLKSAPLGMKDYNYLLYDWYISDKDVKKQLEDLKSDTADLKSDTAGLKSDTADLKSDTAGLKSDTADLKSCLQNLTKQLKSAPPEILARGPRARRAYQMALDSGKTKNLRVPVMLVGQSRAGKTSLLRSLKREEFDPKEDSTEGVKLHRSISKAEEEAWREDETIENSFIDCAAKAIAENLTASTSDEESSTQDEDDENLSLPTNEDKLHQKIDILTVEGRPSGDLGEDTNEPENSSENQMPQEVVEKATYMLQNLKDMDEDECIHLMTMDFAGQPVYQAIHPVFLSPKGIYILVHSLKNDVHDLAQPVVKRGSLQPRKIDDNCAMTNMDHLEFWLSFVASNATAIDYKPQKEPPIPEFNLPRKFPPVFLVCTHADKPFEMQNSEEVSQTILAHLKRKENPSGQHVVHAIYPVDNTVSGCSEKDENKFVKKLRENIRVTAESLPQIGEDIPIRWLKFERELSKLEEKRYITLEEAKNIANECQVDLESDELDTLLNYLHDLKVIIYFEDTNMIITDTQWLLDMFVKVITVQPYLEWQPDFEDYWRKLEDEGILERTLVKHLWSDVVDEHNTIDVLLTVMEKFSLLCKWKCLDGSEVFLVPAMLINSAAESCNELLADPQLPIPLVIKFTKAHLPLGIFPRMLVALAEFCNKKWPGSPLPKFFHNFCRFYDVGGENGFLDLLVTSDMRTITVGVIPIITGNDLGHNSDLIIDFCQLIKDFINNTLNDMRTDCPWMTTMGFEFGICCPTCSKPSRLSCCHKANACMRDTCIHFIPEKELPRCYNDPTNSKTSIKEESYHHWFPKTAEDPNDPAVCSILMEALNLSYNISMPEGDAHQVTIRGTKSSLLRNIDAACFAKQLAALLKLDKLSLHDPPKETVKSCRTMCIYLKKERRVDIIRELRKILPSGMTGPLKNENVLVGDMIGKLEDLTRSLCGNDSWKKMADHLGIRRCHFGFYENKKNPAESILEDVCRKRRPTIGDFYDVLCKCEVNALADEFL